MATETNKPTGAANQAIVLRIPPAGQTVVVDMQPNQVVEVPFDITDANVTLVGDDLRIEFPGNAVLILNDFANLVEQGASPLMMFADGSVVAGDVLLTALTAELPETAAGPGGASGGAGEYRDDMGNLIDTVDRLGTQDPDPFVKAVAVVVEEGQGAPAGLQPPVEDLPDAVPDSYNTTEDTALTISIPGVLGNDTLGGDGGTLAVVASTNPAHGTLTLSANGSFTYTPAANYTGPDSFTYTIRDADGDEDTATVAINVTSVDDLPDAVPDSYNTAEDTALTISIPGVLGNDTLGGDGGTLAVVASTNPAHGTLTLNTNGSFTYTPAANYSGPDSFTYTIRDADGDEDTATVAINVTSVDDLPDAVPDSYNTTEDTALTISIPGVLGNDTLGGDGGTLAVVASTNPAHGTLTLNANGSFTYTPAANYSGPDSFTYTIRDADGDEDTATVTINVATVDDLPDAVTDSYNTTEDTALTISIPGVLGNDTLGDDGGTLAVVASTNPAHGTLTLNANGSFTYTPAANYTGPDSFTYTIRDADGDEDTATVAINVTSVDDLPDAVPDSYNTAEDTALTISIPGVLGNDTLGGDGGTLAVVASTNPAHGTLTLNANGSFTYTPAANYTGPDSFTYTIRDADGDEDTATVAINVTSVDDLPDAVPDSYNTAEDTALTISIPGVLGNDTLGGDGGTLAVVASTNPAHGTLTLNANGSFTYTPAANYTGPDSFTYTIRDADGDEDTATVTINVATVDDLPDAVPDSYNTAEDTALTISIPGVLGNDTLGGDGGTLAVVASTNPAHGTLTLNANGSFTYTPAANYTGPDSFTYTIRDADGDEDTATVTINVATVDDLPDAVPDSYNTTEDTALTISIPGVLGNDTLGGDGGTLAVVASTNPAHGTLTLNANGSFTYTPAANYSGPDSFTYTIRDADGDEDTATVTINVATVDDLPDAVPDSYNTAEDTALTISIPGVLGNDTLGGDGGTLAVVASTNPAHGTLTLNANGSFTYTPAANYTGPDSFTYTIRDADGDEDTATVTITIDPVNDGPDAINNSYTGDEDQAVNGNVITDNEPALGTDSDPDNDALSVTHVNGVALNGNPIALDHGTLTMGTNGTFGFTPAENWSGEQTFTYTITDGDQSDTATVKITIDPDLPDAVNNLYSVSPSIATTNIVLVIDTSGSMAELVNGQTRLALLKDAVENLINTYGDSLNKVMVVDFDSSATVLTTGGQVWMSGTEAISRVNAMIADGYTDYDSAIAAVQENYGTPPLTDNTYIYFLSDGEPTSSDGSKPINPNTIEPAERAAWETFLTQQGIDEVYAVGIGSGVSLADADLQTVAWSSSGNHANNVTLVLDETDLSGTLEMIARTVYGNVLDNDTDPDGDPLTVTAIDGHALGGSPVTVDGAFGTLQIQPDGEFSYHPTNPDQHGYEAFTYTAANDRGQTDTAHIVIKVNDDAGDILFLGTDGDDILQGGAGNDALIGGTGNDLLIGRGGLDQLIGDDGQDIFAFSANGSEGDDIITDFNVADGDVLKFYDVLDADLVDVGIDVAGNDVTLTVNGTSIFIEEFNSQPGVDLADNTTLTLNQLQGSLPAGTLDYTSDPPPI